MRTVERIKYVIGFLLPQAVAAGLFAVFLSPASAPWVFVGGYIMLLWLRSRTEA